MAHLAGQEVLRPDVTSGQAADLLWLLTGFDLLFTGRSMPVAKAAATLIATAERALCR
ncbi:hypothetical protein AB0I81_43715 [Nonomuraea sp. NPDC050404]|uniref:hypothetical protein n=1 Tax=Nonomuraea sp. NPDC050404 TaxID=3155783 RepID=UPI0033EAEC53